MPPTPPSIASSCGDSLASCTHYVRKRERRIDSLLVAGVPPVRLLSLHRHDPGNIGDMMSSPFANFPLLKRLKVGVTMDIFMRKSFSQLRRNASVEEALVIIGGGGLLGYIKTWPGFMREACSRTDCIIWSIGYNNHEYNETPSAQQVAREYASLTRGLLKNVKVAASRDFHVPHMAPWFALSDASCMQHLECANTDPGPGLNQSPVSYYMHRKYASQYSEMPADLNGPRMNNSISDMSSILRFLCAAHVVVTTSYHGAYWAALMGKRVVAINTQHSSKFHFFEHPIVTLHTSARFGLVSVDELRAAIARAVPLPPTALTAARERTLGVYARVLDMLLTKLELHRERAGIAIGVDISVRKLAQPHSERAPMEEEEAEVQNCGCQLPSGDADGTRAGTTFMSHGSSKSVLQHFSTLSRAWAVRERWFVKLTPASAVVLDLGAGAMHLRTALRNLMRTRNVTYLPVDGVRRSAETCVCDFNRADLPLRAKPTPTLLVMQGVLEYLAEPQTFIGALHCAYPDAVLLLSYQSGAAGANNSLFAKLLPLPDLKGVLHGLGFSVRNETACFAGQTCMKAEPSAARGRANCGAHLGTRMPTT